MTSRTNGKRPDYKKLNSTGEVVLIEGAVRNRCNPCEELLDSFDNLKISMTSEVGKKMDDDLQPSEPGGNEEQRSKEDVRRQEKVSQLAGRAEALAYDIQDFMDENDLDDEINGIEDFDSLIKRMEELRSLFRSQHTELQIHLRGSYDSNYKDGCLRVLDVVKEYITDAKKRRNVLRRNEDKEKSNSALAKEKKLEFLGGEIHRRMTALEAIFVTDFSKDMDEDITTKKKKLSEHGKEMEVIAKGIQEVIGEGETPVNINRIQARYDNLIDIKSRYVESLEEETKEREIEKQKNFNKSSLNIELGKFKGYDSSLDIYTFQDQFEKLHLKGTPKSLLPDVLINNYLEGPAMMLVKHNRDIDDIWRRLKEAYGDCRNLLSIKLAELSNLEHVGKQRESSKAVEALSKTINLMRDLMQLAKKHNIETKLYYGGGIEKVYHIMGEGRLSRWLAQTKVEGEGEDQWADVVQFLEKELKVCQQKAMIFTKGTKDKTNNAQHQQKNSNQRTTPSYLVDHSHNSGNVGDVTKKCSFCGEKGHVQTSGPYGMKLVQYFACKKFVEMSPTQRFQALRSKEMCYQCLFPGADCNKGKHKDGRCQTDFVCKHQSHERHQVKKHVLVCEEHKETDENKALLENYKSRCILKQKYSNLPTYAKEIQLTHLVTASSKGTEEKEIEATGDAEEQPQEIIAPINNQNNHNKDMTHISNHDEDFPSNEENGVYMLQTIKVDDKLYTIFYDTGCGRFCVTHGAVQQLGVRARQRCAGPIPIGGVAGVSTEARHGIYSVKIPLADGTDAVMTGACFDKITETFPMYPLAGTVEEDIRRGFHDAGGNLHHLPTLPQFVGGAVDLMIGSTYMRYVPQEIFRMPSGLIIYKSFFKNADGSVGVVGGPHRIFTEIDQRHNFCSMSFIATQRQIFKYGYQVNPDISLLGYTDQECIPGSDDEDITSEENQDSIIQYCQDCHSSRVLKKFEEAETCGSEITYRCIKCRSCKDCKTGDHIEALSIKEEVEQDMIKQSITVDIKSCVTTASLPLLSDPAIKLAPNRIKALKVYYQQLKNVWKNPDDAKALIASEQKLQDHNFVGWVEDLPEEIQEMLRNSNTKNFIPWRVVWKPGSHSTPCRLVFDASMPTDSGFSLNDILPKGINMMNKMVDIFLRWRIFPWAFHCDVQKMYNAVFLRSEYWCLQRYLFQEELDPKIPPKEKVIKTIIYGVTSSGNQAQCALRKTAEIQKIEYPEINEIVAKSAYVDDILSGEFAEESSRQRQDELQTVLSAGGFALKGFTVSGKKPIEELSGGENSISVAGHKWYPEEDTISLDIKELNFARKKRGRKTEIISEIPEKLTKLHCASKLGEIFDPTGIVTPLIAGMKLDLHELNVRKLQWGDVLPNELQPIWQSHFQMMAEMKNLRYQRAIIPHDAADLDITTLDFGDASKSLVCASIYVRFKRKNGEYSCQLLFAKSRLVPDGMSQPRAELFAAVVNAHCGEVVRRSLYKFHKQAFKFTDSQIALYWICNDKHVLKQWARNRVVEIQRFAEKSAWWYVNTENMVADIGTRRCSSLEVVDENSTWIRGLPWMREHHSKFPMMNAEEITLNNQETQNMKKELQDNVFQPSNLSNHHVKSQDNQISKENLRLRYQFSDYVIDPNWRRFAVVVNVLALVLRFIKNVRKNVELRRSQKFTAAQQATKDVLRGSFGIVKQITDEEICQAKGYFFKKASSEVKHFLKPSQYEGISQEFNEILMFNGRILPDDKISITGRATDAMKDLLATTFCVPLVDKYSPIAYSIANEIHWYHPTANHRGIETTWRYTLKEAYIIEGRQLLTKMRKSCERCRYLNKKSLEVQMGPVSPQSLIIAPAFYVSQVDLAGPFLAYCHHHKRNTIKVWFSVFCCATTSTTSIKLMEDYSTPAFVQAFMRFSSDVGFPKLMLCDDGSQIVKGVKSMNLSYQDIRSQLYRDAAVEFEICPVGGHNMNGRVERKIREIKESLSRSPLTSFRLSIMQWETLAATISNTINNMPLALGNAKSNLESLDLLTPNRLKLGRNNERSPVGIVTVSHPEKILEENTKVFNSWFEVWLSVYVPKLLDQPKWFKSEEDLKPGDIVLFLKNESELSSTYQYGMVQSVEKGRDGKIRKVEVRYRNHSEKVDRFTRRAARSLVVIRRAEESSIMEDLAEASRLIERSR